MRVGAPRERDANLGSARRLTAQYGDLREGLVELAWQVTGDRDTAQDVVEDVFVRLLKRIEDGEHLVVGPAYLRTAVRRLSLDRYRDRVKRKHPAWCASVAGESIPVSTPWDAFLVQRLRRLIDESEVELPPGQKTAFQLVDRRGLSYAAAAEEIGTTKNNVKQQIAHARSTIRAILASRGITSLDDA